MSQRNDVASPAGATRLSRHELGILAEALKSFDDEARARLGQFFSREAQEGKTHGGWTAAMSRQAAAVIGGLGRHCTRPRPSPRPRGAGRPAARRATVTTRGSPDDEEPAPRRRATYSYACSPCPRCGAELRIYVDGLYCGNPSCAWGRS